MSPSLLLALFLVVLSWSGSCFALWVAVGTIHQCWEMERMLKEFRGEMLDSLRSLPDDPSAD